MALPSLLPITAVAAPAARDVVERLAKGLPFLEVLGRAGDMREAKSDAVYKPRQDEPPSLTAPAGLDAARLAAIHRDPQGELARFVGHLRKRLAEAGVENTLPIHLKASVRGEVLVDGNHPDRATIEELLSTDQRLTATFRGLAAAFTADHRRQAPHDLPREFQLWLAEETVQIHFE